VVGYHLAYILEAGVTQSRLTPIRRSTYSRRLLGFQEFIRTLEKETKRRLVPQKRGPKKKTDKTENQETFSFGVSRNIPPESSPFVQPLLVRGISDGDYFAYPRN
jgi:hypothetical protein